LPSNRRVPVPFTPTGKWEPIHSGKTDTGIKVGDILTFESGLGAELLREGRRYTAAQNHHRRLDLVGVEFTSN
jgi:hypothetical protein